MEQFRDSQVGLSLSSIVGRPLVLCEASMLR